MLVYKTKDHPEANGRKPQVGDQAYDLVFTLENGDFLRIKMGKEGFDNVTNLLMDMLTEAPPHNDGSVPDLE